MTYKLESRLNTSFLNEIISLFAYTWWTKERRAPELEIMLQHSICFGVCYDGKLVGFARVITDGIFKAVIVDVIVMPEHRNKGVCSLLMEGIFSHDDVSKVTDFELYCQPDLIPLYQKYGFEVAPNGVVFMRATL